MRAMLILTILTATQILSANIISSPVSDLKVINHARALFQKNRLDDALKVYEMIPQSSNYWLEAMEERAHTLGRKGDFAGALALLQTVTAPTFDGLVGPEPFFVTALTHLKICNYSEIFKVTQNFKSRFKPRIDALQLIVDKGSSPAVEELQKRLRRQPLNSATIGALTPSLPRHLVNDKFLAANPLAARERARSWSIVELKEINSIIDRLNIIEAEVIHRVHLVDASKRNRTKQGAIPDGNDFLKFQVTDEIWIDELDHYRADIDKCPYLVKRVKL